MKQSFCFSFLLRGLEMQNVRNQRRSRVLERSREPDFWGLNDNGDFAPCFTEHEDGKRIFV